MSHDRAPEPREELRGRERVEEGRAAVVALGVDGEDEPRGDAERKSRMSILVGNPAEVGLQGLELGALVDREVELHEVLAARVALRVGVACDVEVTDHCCCCLTRKESCVSVCWQQGWQSRVTARLGLTGGNGGSGVSAAFAVFTGEAGAPV